MKGFFKGSATALITPFFNNGGVNYEVYGELIEAQIAGGTDALILLGTTGEPSTMSFAEEHELMDYAVKKINGRCKVIFGCGSNNTADAIMTAQKAESYGADGLLAVTPYYNKCTQNGLVAYYKAICEAVSISCMHRYMALKQLGALNFQLSNIHPMQLAGGLSANS